MKRWLAILLLGTYLCSATELHQLLKLPALVGHYMEHAEADNDETFPCFLADHYLSGEHHDADEDHDHNLPFSCHHDCTSHSLQVASPTPFGEVVYNVPSSPTEPHALDASSYSFLLSRDVWQPPKA